VTRAPLPARDLLAVSLGGALGAVLRWTITEASAGGSVPWATLAINAVGCLVLGALPVLGVVRRSPTLARFLGPGVLGGFTTVSAMAVETVDLADTGEVLVAFAYAAGTLLLCLAAAAAGRALVHRRTEAAA
jgi:CrcB protein